MWLIVANKTLQAVSPSEPLSKRFDRSRRLFEQVNDDDEDEAWRENEIAKKHEQQREKDMQVCNWQSWPEFNVISKSAQS